MKAKAPFPCVKGFKLKLLLLPRPRLPTHRVPKSKWGKPQSNANHHLDGLDLVLSCLDLTCLTAPRHILFLLVKALNGSREETE